jgi:arylsulfatase A
MTRLGAFLLLLLPGFSPSCQEPLGRILGQDSIHPTPNVVLFFTDDQGWADIGVQGAEGFLTPNLDRLASEGIRFTDFYVAQPVCSASRAALLTGCYPNRIGIAGALGPGARHGLHAEEVTLAEIFKGQSYATAIFGKWHLGHRRPFLPLQHGFDEFFGIPYSNDMWPRHPDLAKFPTETEKRKRGYPDLPLYGGNEIVVPVVEPEDQARFTTGFTDRGVDFIRRNAERPFFLYMPHPMPHVPLFASGSSAGRSARGLYGDVIEEIDESVGRILQVLEELDLDEKTLVIFASDNGPWLSYGNHGGSAKPLREGKGTTFDGGVRVPFLARWPGRIPEGSVCNTPAMTIDILPTLASLLGAPLGEKPIDGRNIGPLLFGIEGAVSPQPAYYFWYGRNNLEAMRSGRWKLHFPHGYRSMNGNKPGKDGKPGLYDYSVKTGIELYDLEADIGESKDLAATRPEVVTRLVKMAEAMRNRLGDDLTDTKGSENREPGRIVED